jgi:hypothetical protein
MHSQPWGGVAVGRTGPAIIKQMCACVRVSRPTFQLLKAQSPMNLQCACRVAPVAISHQGLNSWQLRPLRGPRRFGLQMGERRQHEVGLV